MTGTWFFRRAITAIRCAQPFRHMRHSLQKSFRRYNQTGSGNGSGKNGGKVNKTSFHDSGGNWPATIWAAYLAQLDKRPLFTKMWTSGLLNAIGDILAQNLIEKETPFDPKRLMVFTSLGVIFVGPALHYWYSLLAKIFAVPGAKTAVGSVALDQLAFAPCFCAVFLSSLLIIETRNPSLVVPKLEQDLFSTVIMNWKIWVPSQMVNFWLVPPPLRVLFANIVALVWNTYLSFAAHKKIKT